MCLREQHRERPWSCVVLVEGRRGSRVAGQLLLSNRPFGDICHPVRYLPCPHGHLGGQGGGIGSVPIPGPIGGSQQHTCCYL